MNFMPIAHKHRIGLHVTERMKPGILFPPDIRFLPSVSWLLLIVGFIRIFDAKTVQARVLVTVTTVWALLMLISRLRLGLHYPIDLFISTLIAWLIHWAIFLFLEKKRSFSIN